MDLEEIFNVPYTDDEKDVFTEALVNGKIKKSQLNKDVCVFTVHINEMDSYCVIYEAMNEVYFRNFMNQALALDFHKVVIDLYGN